MGCSRCCVAMSAFQDLLGCLGGTGIVFMVMGPIALLVGAILYFFGLTLPGSIVMGAGGLALVLGCAFFGADRAWGYKDDGTSVKPQSMQMSAMEQQMQMQQQIIQQQQQLMQQQQQLQQQGQ